MEQMSKKTKNKDPEIKPQDSAKPEPAPKKVVKEVAGVQIDVTPAQKIVPSRRYTFTQWAVRRGKKPQHQPGMKAFVKNPDKSRTIEEWDKLFLTY